jgi:hypothetical protein
MAKLIYVFIAAQIIVNSIHGQQVTPSESEMIEDVKYFRERTISLGVRKIDTFEDASGKWVAKEIFKTIGTGVCLYVKKGDKVIPCLLTAKHVLFDSSNAWSPKAINIRFSEADTLEIDSFFGTNLSLYDSSKPIWIEHPDKGVDLACILLDSHFQWPLKKFPMLPYSYFANDEDYFEGKEVFVLGYPGAIGMDLLNKAFLRKGIIASVPTNKYFSNKKILIDCNIFPGNSGGPVFSISHNRGQILSDTILQGARFYGIISQRRFSYNEIQSKKGKVTDMTGNIIYSSESIAVGIVVSTRQIRELLEHVKAKLK